MTNFNMAVHWEVTKVPVGQEGSSAGIWLSSQQWMDFRKNSKKWHLVLNNHYLDAQRLGQLT